MGTGSGAFKRAVDVVISLALLVVSSPLLVVIAIAVALEDGNPVLFRQPRAGRDGRPFHLLKFRSMEVNEVPPEVMGQVRTDHHMVTRVGGFLRRTRLDELPQLVNVLRGEMSLVGPRPPLTSDLAGYDAYQRRRLLVRPGVTGWAQVNGALELTWPERILLDVWYVDHRTARLDLAILLRTVMVVIRGERTRPAALEAARQHAGLARQAG